MHTIPLTSRCWGGILALALVLPAQASDKATPAKKGEAAIPQAAVIPAEAWLKASDAKLTSAEIDRLVAKELQASSLAVAPKTSDEQFIRRVTLDLTGHLPAPADVSEFAVDPNANKRARLIDRLLASEEYARHWARYWRDVIENRATANMVFLRAPRPQALEAWFFDQIKSNTSWANVARAMVTSEGTLSMTDPTQDGAAGFLLAHFGQDAAVERASETARVFLGIQLQCAQCHDHPSDIWKREQFHQLAAFFGRTREQPQRGAQQVTSVALTGRAFGEHQMPDLNNPGKGTTMQPKFLNGAALPAGKSDKERRAALADQLTAKENYWFAGAYVNRLWGELMGQSFYQPIDDMGPQKEAFLPTVLPRLAAGFRGGNYDTKDFFRVVLNTEAYQRQIRLGESSDQHLLFAASYPTRLRADALWQSLVNVLGNLGDTPQGRPGGPMFGGGPFARFQTLEFGFKRLFAVDPSVKADEVEGSIPQALIFMNNPTINQKIEAKDANLLARILKSYPKEDEALGMVYLRTLARKPTDGELEKCRTFITKVGNRAEAYEDILWALLNSTEFQTKR